MASKDDSWRFRDEFPQVFAAWMAAQTAARRASEQVRQSRTPTGWSVAVVTGGLALALGFVLLFTDPPQTASLGSSQRRGLLGHEAANVVPANLELGVQWLQPQADWDERPYDLWTSTVPDDGPTALAYVRDDWSAAQSRSEVKTGPAQPYFLRINPIDFKDLVAAVAAAETPAPLAGPEFSSNVRLTIERSPATLTESGTLAYTLHVQNLGHDVVEHVRVIETLPQAEHVVDTLPPAAMTYDGAFVWELDRLAGQETRDLQVFLDAGQVTAPLQTVAALDIETQLAVRTLVAPAALSEPALDETITPELALPDPDPAPAAAPHFDPGPAASEPISPLLADDAPPPLRDDWNAFGQPSPTSETPISPLLVDEDAPPSGTSRPEPQRPQYEPLEPLPRRQVAPTLADQPIEPEFDTTPEPRPLPLDSEAELRPVLSLKARSDSAVRAGDVVTTVYEIVNTGDAPAEGIVLTVFVPPELRHKHGQQVEHRIHRLQPGESHRARLLTRASSAGTAQLDAVLSHNGQADEQHVLKVKVLAPGPSTGSRSPRQ